MQLFLKYHLDRFPVVRTNGFVFYNSPFPIEVVEIRSNQLFSEREYLRR